MTPNTERCSSSSKDESASAGNVYYVQLWIKTQTSMSEMTFAVETEITAFHLNNLLDFIQHQYVMPHPERFTKVTKTEDNEKTTLAFTMFEEEKKDNLDIEITASLPIQVKATSNAPIDQQTIDLIKEDMIILVASFEEQVRKNTLFFTWREGDKIIPEKLRGKEDKTLKKMLLETQISLFILFVVASIFLFFFLGWITPIILIAFQLVFVFFSDRIIARSGNWNITENNPIIHIFEYQLPMDEHAKFKQKYPNATLFEMKREIYEKTLAIGKSVDCSVARDVFLKHGFECKPENMSTKVVNVYQLVKSVADRFNFQVPRIVVSNTLIPNAAASGPSPKRGVVLITTGLLTRLTEDEIISVLGHEFGHLRGRDPLILFGLTATEFLFRFYIVLVYFPIIFTTFLFIPYFILVMGIIFFIAKFFEARADLVSAMVVKQPQVLAKALQKIGFQRLLYERTSSFRVQEWTSWDPHPPIYFRVSRLEKIQEPVKVKHPLIQSMKDVTRGFLASI